MKMKVNDGHQRYCSSAQHRIGKVAVFAYAEGSWWLCEIMNVLDVDSKMIENHLQKE